MKGIYEASGVFTEYRQHSTLVKLSESSFCEVFGFFESKTSTEVKAALKIVPLLTNEAPPSFVPEPVPINLASHEASAHMALASLQKHRKYAIPSGHTGFNSSKRYLQNIAFIYFCRIKLLQGSYPDRLISKWDEWAASHSSENSRPGKSNNITRVSIESIDVYRPMDLFMVFEMEYGGIELEKFKPTGAVQIASILNQLIYSLSLGEENIEFEHRDL